MIREIVREVPVEIIKEVEKEKLVTVSIPAELTYAQKYKIDFADKYFAAPILASEDDIFYGIASFKIAIYLSDAVKKLVSEDRVRNKLELVLRRNGLSVDPDSDYSLLYQVDGNWGQEDALLAYTHSLKIMEMITFARDGDLRRGSTSIWENRSFGYVGKDVAEKVMLDNIDKIGDNFSIRYLRVMDREKR